MMRIISKAPKERYCLKNNFKIFCTKEEMGHKAGNSSTPSTRKFKGTHHLILFHLSWKGCTSMHICGLGHILRSCTPSVLTCK